MSRNDERIMNLKKQIEEKREKLSKQTGKFVPITNCLLTIDKVTYNLHVESNELLLIKLNMMSMSAKDLGLDISTIVISGYSLADWIEDVNNFLKVKAYKEEKSKLNRLEKQLDTLLSDDKKTELEINSIEALLK